MKNKKDKSIIACIFNDEISGYNIKIPFNPPKNYPELSKFNFDINPKNLIYEMVRNLLIKLDLDSDNIGKQNWNPFSDFIKSGDQVLIKPNFVKDFHPKGIEGVISQITHASILRPIIDYILLALKNTGKIIIADTPLEKADFENILKITKTKDLLLFYKNFLKTKIEIYDLRSYKRKKTEKGRFILKKIPLDGPPKGFIKIDLKSKSELVELDNKSTNYYTLADYSIDRFNPYNQKYSKTNIYHNRNEHIYKIPRLVMESDVIFSVPKLKTHRMAGVTLNLKNMIGICEKIYLPHYRQGAPPFGDATRELPPRKDVYKKKIRTKIDSYLTEIIDYLRSLPFLNKILRYYYRYYLNRFKVDTEWYGTWYGNDTLWRTIFDLNKIVLYGNKAGKMERNKQRKYFSIIDGIIGQDGEGPMTGEPNLSHIIIGGFDPVALDAYSAYIMGYDINKLKIIYKNQYVNDFNLGENDINNIIIKSNLEEPKMLDLRYTLPKGYKILSRSNSKC